MNQKQIHIKMDSRLHTLLKVEAAKKDMSLQDLVVGLLSSHFFVSKEKFIEECCDDHKKQ